MISLRGILCIVYAAILAASAKVQSRKAVSLLFDNDGDWEHLGDHASALLFHEPSTGVEASAICEQNNEVLFPLGRLSEISGHISYLQFTGDIPQNAIFWVEENGEAHATKSVQNETALPFLCTNSAPHTTKVDTDYTANSKTEVVSDGTVFTGTRDHLTFRFMGIPFAQSPTDSLRFQHAQAWNGETVDATAFKPGCLQFGSFANNDIGLNPWGISEDCLFLNVFTPFVPANSADNTTTLPALKPVLFWVHGGANINGIGSDATFDGGPLSSRSDVVVVTINYRLNIFSSLALNDGVVTGNYGLSDKVAALQWVKENIKAFGGDPERVTIFGQSAGGWSIIDLVKSPKGKGLFAGAISQSGGSGTFSTAAQAGNTTVPVISQLCNGTVTERLECLQALPAETLLNVTQTLGSWGSVQDGEFVIDSMVNQVSQGPSAINSVPFLVGFMPDEGQSLASTNISPNDTDFNQALARVGISPSLVRVAQESGLWEISDELTPYNATQNVFGNNILTCPAEQMITAATRSEAFPALYVYTMLRGYALSFFDPYNLCTFPAGHPELRSTSYLCHSADLYEVFGTFHIFDQPIRVPEDTLYSSLIQDLWGSFARTGNPNPDKELLRARGKAYEGTLNVLEGGWVWPQFGAGEQEQVALLDVPEPLVADGMPDEKNGRCAVIMGAMQ